MQINRLRAAITLAISSSALLGATQVTKAGDIVALNTNANPALGIGASTTTLMQKNASSEELLGRGLARITTAKQPSDFRVAFDYFRMAAQKGNAEAQFQLAIMQLDNEYVDQDEEAAIRWLEKASGQGHQQAAIALDYVIDNDGDFGC